MSRGRSEKMNEQTQNFVRDGKEGDLVWYPRLGNGRIFYIDADNNVAYPIMVQFDGGATAMFTAEGYDFEGDPFPSLCWGHRDPVYQGVPPQRPLQNLHFTGEPTWAWVGDMVGDFVERRRRLVVAFDPKRDFPYVAVNKVRTTTQSWKFAWEIPGDAS